MARSYRLPRTDDGSIPHTLTREDLLGIFGGSVYIFECDVTGIPAGVTLSAGWFVVQRNDEAAPVIDKNITTSSGAAIGLITDTGADGTGHLRFYFSEADTVSLIRRAGWSLSVRLSNNETYDLAHGAMQATRTMAVHLPGDAVGNGTLPPDAQNLLALAFDPSFGSAGQTHASRVGPTAQLGSTSGSDTNDPTLTLSGGPARYVFGADDYLTFGDQLDDVLANPAGWTMLHCATVTSPATLGEWVCKDDDISPGDQRTFIWRYENEAVDCILWLSDGTMTRVQAAVPTPGRYIFGVRFNPAAAQGQRLRIFYQGVPNGAMPTGEPAGSLLPRETTAPLSIGKRPMSNSSVAAPEQGWVLFYAGLLTDTNILNNATWLINGGWS